MFIVYFHLSPDIWLTPLMVLGTQWYILFNVVAGAAAFPGDLKEVEFLTLSLLQEHGTLIVGDIQIELGCTTTGDSQFDAMRLATTLEQAVRMGSVKPREVDAAAVIAGLPNGPVGDDAHLPYLSQLFRSGAS